jgi:predicted Zn-ribbon and HTH transcriptional regulator
LYRKGLIPLLLDHPMTVVEIAAQLGISPRDVADDLAHLLKSLEHSDYVAVVTPAHCRKCEFTFEKHKLKKPSKCPRCRGTWIEPPKVHVENRS